ncbi:MAG: GntR family transcriptional regulator [Desulfobacteraceae bacterium]|nr:GntR family transcriptional regulator [Desulfobacteraceae bacterium]
MLNSQSPIPLYHQLADIILEKIRSGKYPPGYRIPSEHSLASEYAIGRPTARQATDLLVRRRMLVRKRGAGTFVTEEKKEVDLFSLAGTITSFKKKGISVKTKILQKIALKKVGNDIENPFSNKEAFFLSRLSTVNKKPALLEDIYLHPVLFSGIHNINMEDRSLSRVVKEKYYMRPIDGKQNFRIGHLSENRAGYLDVSKDTSILVVKRILNFEQAEGAIYSELFCRTDRFVFSQTIGGLFDD